MRMTKANTRTNQGGFTILELAISAAIAILVSLVVVKFWIVTSEAFSLDGNMMTIKEESERALEIMTERIQRASDATIIVSNGNATIDFVDVSNSLNPQNVQYTLEPLAPGPPIWGQIVQTVNGTQGTIAGYVESLQFTTSATGLVTITARFHKGAGRPETALTVQANAAARS